ncbi:hypothetical protein [Aliiruegeria sabulilitoris]|uniref:DUF1281 family ferredoxin-like fold protein n=1 Tax=Aliiruegeria sabulilitoris TaxID=1510458 RepID=UPI00082AB400|nr:hypothetical protein [Aliiruegeria sabulilitoris]NDR56312.1 hypothetical protein [Pseudoruegeria sp. M32A2M]
MPDLIMNRLYASAEVLDALGSEDTLVDLEKFTPPPEVPEQGEFEAGAGEIALRVAPHSSELGSNDGSETGPGQGCNALIDREYLDVFRSMDALWRNRDPDFCRLGAVSLFGQNLGWAARESVREPDHLRFLTAWSEPSPVIREISIRYPGEDIRLDYASPDRSNPCGVVVFKAGEILEMRKGDTSFAHDVWRDDEDTRS